MLIKETEIVTLLKKVISFQSHGYPFTLKCHWRLGTMDMDLEGGSAYTLGIKDGRGVILWDKREVLQVVNLQCIDLTSPESLVAQIFI
ncbi:hypothetical protein CEXT_452821 [Caerostris extrusa]|uniref:Uncharacterized protein n=1 Tax=Caerostris extrusa TaxID=172846 RepID=A0AAV4V1Z9_CAEEX|nr:hypothetical protein CEXT_452821 [Caerostris extrusa]